MYQFNKFWFIYINRWRNELKDLETLGIGMVVLINAVKNKDFVPKKIYVHTIKNLWTLIIEV